MVGEIEKEFADIEREYNELLEKAMKMPGLADLMKLYGDIDKRVKECTIWIEEDEYYFATNSDSSSSF